MIFPIKDSKHVMRDKVYAPLGSPAQFSQIVDQRINDFRGALALSLIDRREFKISHYHILLNTLFHQTYSGPYTFAKAASACSWKHASIKEYLLVHAYEERTHWRWVLDDLNNTGFAGEDPRTQSPHPSCEAYICFNDMIAERAPFARLAIATVLEGIGARVGGEYGRKLLTALAIGTHQASFFLSYCETDMQLSRELADVIGATENIAGEWDWMCYAADMAGQFYRAMYDHDGFADVTVGRLSVEQQANVGSV